MVAVKNMLWIHMHWAAGFWFECARHSFDPSFGGPASGRRTNWWGCIKSSERVAPFLK